MPSEIKYPGYCQDCEQYSHLCSKCVQKNDGNWKPTYFVRREKQ